MAQEAKRGCGYRHVGGIYLVGGLFHLPCDRLPFPLEICPCCGRGIRFNRAPQEINPLEMFGTHDEPVTIFNKEPDRSLVGTMTIKKVNCFDRHRPCIMCDPTSEPAYLMCVGEKYYPSTKDFLVEAGTLGVSKRLTGAIPEHLVPGKTVVFLAHNRACEKTETIAVQQALTILNGSQPEAFQPKLMEAEQVTKHFGVFSAFIPKRIEKIYWKSQLTKAEREKCAKKGITPVVFKDGDQDHA